MNKIFKIKFIFPLIIIFHFAFSAVCFAQSGDTASYNYKSNYDIISELFTKSLSKIEDRIISAGKEKTYLLSFDSNPGNGDIGGLKPETRSFLQSLTFQRLSSYRLITDSSLKYDTKIDIYYPSLNVSYSELHTKGILGDRSVKRICSIHYLCSFHGYPEMDFTFNDKHEDIISLDRISQVEDPNFRFTKSELPRETVLNKIIVPAAILISTAAAIVLFFIIRK